MTDSQGTNGAIVFGEDRQKFIAAFFAEHSNRNPFGRAVVAANGAGLLERIPLELKPLASALPSLTFDDNRAAVTL